MRTLTLLSIILAAAGSLQAQEGRTWVDLQGGNFRQKDSWTRNRPSLNFRNSTGFGAGLGTWVTDHWAVELSALFSDIQLVNARTKAHEAHGFVSVLYDLQPSYVWAPYLTVGAGATHLDAALNGNQNKATVPNFFGGAGCQFFPFEHLQVGFEGRMVRIQAKEQTGGFRREEGQLLVSVGYRWRRN